MKLRHIGLWSVGLGAATAAVLWAVPPRDVLRAAWELVAQVQIDAARARFASVAAGRDATAREAKLGQALTLLSTQPRTEGNIAQAEALLREVQAGGRDDESGITAAYTLARIAQMHRFTPDSAAAREMFTALHQAHPEHPLGQMALVKATLLRLFDPGPEVALPERLRTAEAVAGHLREADARRDYHLLMADAYAYFGPSAGDSLRHLLAAEEAAEIQGPARGDIWIRIAQLARETGRIDLLRKYGERFVREYPRDNRTFTLRRQLEEVRP